MIFNHAPTAHASRHRMPATKTRAIRGEPVACAGDGLNVKWRNNVSYRTWNKKSGIHEANKV